MQAKIRKKYAEILNKKYLDMDDFLFSLEMQKYSPEVISARVESMIEKKVLSKYKLSAPNLKILYIILVHGVTTQRDILEHLYTTPANLSQRIELLRKKDIINVSSPQEAKDRRKKVLTLTPKGKKITTAALQETTDFKKTWMEQFTQEEILNVIGVYLKISKILDKIEGKFKV